MRKILTTPFLENGDRLNRWEFEKRYQAMGKIQKAELIEGVVYMPAALRFRSHVKLARLPSNGGKPRQGEKEAFIN